MNSIPSWKRLKFVSVSIIKLVSSLGPRIRRNRKSHFKVLTVDTVGPPSLSYAIVHVHHTPVTSQPSLMSLIVSQAKAKRPDLNPMASSSYQRLLLVVQEGFEHDSKRDACSVFLPESSFPLVSFKVAPRP